MFAFLQNVGPWQLLVMLIVLFVIVGIPIAIIAVVLLLVNNGRAKDKAAAGRICRSCGCKTAVNAEFCANCGKRLGDA